jgi:transposase-like protein
MCETLNSQIKRRTRVVGLFPNESSLLRLVTGVIIEISEEWETGKIYLQPQPNNNNRTNRKPPAFQISMRRF